MKNYKQKNLKTLSPVFLFRTLFFKDRSDSESYGSQDSTMNKLRLLDNNWSGSLFLSSTSTSKNYRRITLSAFLLFASVTMFGQIEQRGNATTATAATNNMSSLTINKPTGVVAGDVLIVSILQNETDNDNGGLANATSTGWILIDGKTVRSEGTGNGNNAWYGTILYRVADGSEGASFEFTLPNSRADMAIGSIVAFSGVSATGGVNADGTSGGPFDVDPSTLNVATADGTTATATTLTTATANSAIVMLAMVNNDRNYSNWVATSPASFTELFDNTTTGSDDGSIGAAWAILSTAGATGSGRVTLSGSNRWGSILIALKPECETVSSASSSPILCVNSDLTEITHTTTRATGIGTATGLPSGLTAEWESNTITISGTPTEAGTFNYSIPLTGICGDVTATGTIVVNELPVVTASASTTTFCGSGSVDLTGSSVVSETNVIATVGFENTSNYAVTGGSTKTGSSPSTSRPASTAYANTGATAYWINNGTATITTQNFTGLSSGVTKTVSMELASFSNGSSFNGADSSDYVSVEISLDGGTTYSQEIEVNGGGNSYWGFSSGTGVASVTYDGDNTATVFAPTGGGARTTDGYSLLQITLPTSATQVTIRVTMLNNSNNEAWVIDDIIVSQPIVPTYSWTSNPSGFTSSLQNPTGVSVSASTTYTLTTTNPVTGCSGSDEVAITVNPNLPASVSVGASATTICSGTSVTFTATPTNGGTTPSYQWKLNGSNVGTDSSTYTSTTLANNDVVTVVMTSNLTSCLTGSPATSNTVTMTLNDPIGITAITPAVNHLSGSATTTITASGVVGSNAVVSWYTGSGQVGFLGTGLTSPAVGFGTYYAVVTGSCGSSVELSTTIRRLNIWTGAVSTLWHVHGNWSEGIDPDANTDVIIETGKIVEINRTGLNNAYAHSIDISGTSTLTVKSGNNLTLTDGFSTPAASSFVVESNANLIQLSTAANTTPITVKRETSTLKRLDYILWSSPVVGQNMLAFSPLTTLSPTIRFYSYNTSLNYYNSVPSPSTTNFTTGIGNLIRLPYNHPTAPVVWSGTFAGVPNNGTITVPVTSDPTDATKRYNLIGNPYPSPISIESFIDGNTNNIIAPLYFWRKTNGSTNKSYWAISKVGHTSSGEGTNPNGVIQVGQGFLVQAKANATQVVFNNSMRVLNNNNQFFKTTTNNLTNNASRVWLKMTNATGDYSQALVGYFDNATLGIDEEIDAKDINDGVIGINSVINNVDYTIQGRPTFNTNDVVPLSYKVTTAGSYTISIDQVDGLFTGGAQNIFLRDNVLGTCNNLSSSAYTFTSNPGSFQSRFELLYQNSLLSNNTAPAFNASEVVIYHQKSDLVINTGVATMSSIKIFNIKGALLFDKKEINASETRVDIGSTNEVLLVEIVTTEGVKVVKKVFSELVIGSDDDE